MKVLVAEDDLVSRRSLELLLCRWGYEVTVAEEGMAAWGILQREDSPKLAILDWMMPGIDGVEVCRRVRAHLNQPQPYLILLSARGAKEDIITGLEAGADDYVTKPVDLQELRARVRVGSRTAELVNHLSGRLREMEEAMGKSQ